MISSLNLKYARTINFCISLLFIFYVAVVGILCFYPLTANLNSNSNSVEKFKMIGKAPVIVTLLVEMTDFSFYLNILMTVPFEIFVISLFKKHLAQFSLGVISFGLGLLIESTQFVLDNLDLMTRFVDINDVFANALGVQIGYLIAFAFYKFVRKRFTEGL